MKDLIVQLRISLVATSPALILCGVYPLTVWVLAQGVFPYRANGSLVKENDRLVAQGSSLRGFSPQKYFHPRLGRRSRL